MASLKFCPQSLEALQVLWGFYTQLLQNLDFCSQCTLFSQHHY
ncbi:hypothetical protein [Wolbachia endosymbiont (group A) of Volucella inflata]|nr:hypothetical protein [Wolbachia endosymbiont (group A) of Volucella inflata]